MIQPLLAGAATTDLTPEESQFLFGYPHVERYSTGVHDPLLASALYLSDGNTEVLFIANDLIFVGTASARRIRTRLSEATGIPVAHIMVTATHTHSGPITVDYLSNQGDPVVPPVNPAYLAFLEDQIVTAGSRARAAATEAEAGFVVARAPRIGTHRRRPDGPRDPDVPVLLVRAVGSGHPLACMIACAMHPTVLHEDSTLVSADFPGATRRWLQEQVLGADCPVLHHTGPCGNQSPRHVARSNTFEEAERLGGLLGKAVAEAVAGLHSERALSITCGRELLHDLPRRTHATMEQARQGLASAVGRLDQLRRIGASREAVRTAECDWFGAEETLVLAKAAANGALDKAYASVLPAEVQAFRIGDRTFVGWPGEVFVEYSLAVKSALPDTFVFSLANGELQGYIVTPEAATEGWYEASNALFAPAAGDRLVEVTRELVRGLK